MSRVKRLAILAVAGLVGCGLTGGEGKIEPAPPVVRTNNPPPLTPFAFTAGSPVISNSPGVDIEYGAAVAGGGDFNGDGHSDYLIASLLFNSARGAVNIFHGPPTGTPVVLTLSPAETVGAHFGQGMAVLGDINGDGFDDAAIGAPFENAATGEADAGVVRVFLGGPDGLNTDTPQVLEPVVQADANCGFSVGAAGDVNGDNLADLIVGCPGYGSTFAREGRAVVYLGQPGTTGVVEPPELELDPADEAQSELGTSVAGAGDVDADGLADLIIGAPGYTNNLGDETGRVYVFTTASNDKIYTPTIDAGRFGEAVAGVGDIDGNGYADVLIGAPGQDSLDGRAHLYRADSAGLADEPSDSVSYFAGTGALTPQTGSHVAGAGDLNGDGYADILIAANRASTSSSSNFEQGVVGVYYGTPGSLTLPGNQKIFGEDVGSKAGPIAGIGDSFGDGTTDFVVGEPGADSFNGKAKIYRGFVATGMPVASSLLDDQNAASSRFGEGLGRVGDLNGDGLDDVVIGAPSYTDAENNQGSWVVYYGKPGNDQRPGVRMVSVAQADAAAGNSVAGGDINGDGFDDLVVGIAGFDGTVEDEGRVEVYYGESAGVESVTPVVVSAPAGASGTFGYDVAVVDVDRDGFGDVLVGAPLAGVGSQGAVAIYRGSADGIDAAAPTFLDPPTAANEMFGFAIDTAGDVNGDGFTDVVVGAPGGGAPTGEGRMYVYHGGPSGLPAAASFDDDPTAIANTHFGHAVAGLGDVNGDGYGDVLIGIPDQTGGEATLYYGSMNGLSNLGGTSSANLSPPLGNGSFGNSVAGIGDTDGDGVPDYAIGSPGDGDAGIGYGFDIIQPRLVVEGSPANETGFALAAAGDVNGDGFSDWVLGSPENNGGRAEVVFGGDRRVGLHRQLRQLDYDGRAMALGNRATYNQVTVRMRVTQEDIVGGELRLEVELKPWNEAWTGTGTVSDPVATGAIAEVTFTDLADIPYKWRARIIHAVGRGTSRWIEYGVGLPGFDFIGNSTPVPVDPPDGGAIGPDAGDGVGQRSLYACGVGSPHSGGSGSFLAVLIAMLWSGRRRSRRRR